MKAEELTKALIKHLEQKDNKDQPYITHRGKEVRTYSINEIIEEVKNQTKFGKQTESNILGLAVDLLKEVE